MGTLEYFKLRLAFELALVQWNVKLNNFYALPFKFFIPSCMQYLNPTHKLRSQMKG